MPKLPRPQGKRVIEPSPKDKKSKPIKVTSVTEDNVVSPKKEPPIPEPEESAEEPMEELLEEESAEELEPSEDEELRLEYEESLKELNDLASDIQVSQPSISKDRKLNIEKPITREEYLRNLKADILELLKDKDFKESLTKELDLAVQALDNQPLQQFNHVVSQNEIFLNNLRKIFDSFEVEASTGFRCAMIDSHFQDFPSFSFGLLNKFRPDIDIIDESILRWIKDNRPDIHERYVREGKPDSVFSNLLYGSGRYAVPSSYIVSDRLRRLRDPLVLSKGEWIFVSILNEDKTSISDYVLVPTGHGSLFKEYMNNKKGTEK